MWLRNILGRVLSGHSSSLDLAMTVEKRPSPFSDKAFREFTPAPRSQRGGGVRVPSRQMNRLAAIGIIPATGVKVP